MAVSSSKDKEFIAAWQRLGSAAEVAKHLNIGVRAVFDRRRSVESRYGISLKSINSSFSDKSSQSQSGKKQNE